MKDRAAGDKATQVREMFSAIARRYDLLNRLLSLGFDRRWRAEATREALRAQPTAEQGRLRILDVATGTADLALALKRARPDAEVVGVDFAEPMLELGRRKALQRGLDVKLEQGDALALPYADARFDVLSIAYGLRNFADIDAGMREFYRVLRPGGRLVVLEFPPPPRGVLGRLFRVYFLRVLPRLGGLISGRKSAYSYLPASVLAFPPPPQLAERLREAGFERVRFRVQTFGVSALHVAVKPLSLPDTPRPHTGSETTDSETTGTKATDFRATASETVAFETPVFRTLASKTPLTKTDVPKVYKAFSHPDDRTDAGTDAGTNSGGHLHDLFSTLPRRFPKISPPKEQF